MTEAPELSLVPQVELTTPTAIAALFTTKGMDPILAEIERRANDFTPDVSTPKGRKEIASMAAKVARSKTFLDGVGKDHVADLKAKAKVVDTVRKHMRDTLDDLKIRVRKPLTDWEAAEEERIKKRQDIIEAIMALSKTVYDNGEPVPAHALKENLAALEAITLDPDWWDEFLDIATEKRAEAIGIVSGAFERQEKHEAEMAELARLRREEEERKAREAAEREAAEQKAREERIAREAAEKARLEAEAKAQAEREAAARRERELKEAAEKAERERIAAEEQARWARVDAKIAEQRAAEKARQEAEEKARLEQEEAERRAADEQHRRRVYAEAFEDILMVINSHGFVNKAAIADAVLAAIKNNAIRNVTINY